jgi:hypothetical protein
MAWKTVNSSEWAPIEQQPHHPSKLKVAGSIPAGVAMSESFSRVFKMLVPV